ncbi:MAG: type IV pilin protein [Burkholderiaceae bacterium]|nr:type IV pilin protein [Burkholderiaceae bacterium]
MHAHPHFVQRRRADSHGFTLVELMLVVVVIGLLAAVALPSFIDSVRKSRRSDAFAAIAAVQQAQERWRSNHSSYATVLGNTAESGQPPDGLQLLGTSTGGYYTLALSNVTSTSYTVTATAVSSKSQAQDANCQLLAVRMQGGNVDYGSGATAADLADPGKCWAR